MHDITHDALSPEQRLQLSVEEHARALTEFWRARKGHIYVQGVTGTGKSTVARVLATQPGADLFCCELMSPDEFKAEQEGIIARMAASRKKVLILDGFFPQQAGGAFVTLLSVLQDKGVSLFVFSQEPLVPDGPAWRNDVTVDPDVFATIAEFRYSSRAHHFVTLHQAK